LGGGSTWEGSRHWSRTVDQAVTVCLISGALKVTAAVGFCGFGTIETVLIYSATTGITTGNTISAAVPICWLSTGLSVAVRGTVDAVFAIAYFAKTVSAYRTTGCSTRAVGRAEVAIFAKLGTFAFAIATTGEYFVAGFSRCIAILAVPTRIPHLAVAAGVADAGGTEGARTVVVS
jgi:hypothetical protein